MSDLAPLSPLFAIALILAVGYLAGLLSRRLGAPAVTGNILAGVLMGPSALGVFEKTIAHDLEPITLFAMSLMTALVGGHLSYRRLHNSLGRILTVTLFEVGLVVVLVVAAMVAAGARWEIALLLGALAAATAPATVLAVVREERAKGLLVKTLLATVALDNVLCVILFSICVEQVASAAGSELSLTWGATADALVDVLFAIALGAVLGGALLLLARTRGIQPFTGLFMGILLTAGGAQWIGISPLLACLSLGVVLGNSRRENEDLISGLESMSPILFTCFFTLAGIDLQLDRLPEIGILGGSYFLARGLGKIGGGWLGASLGRALPRIRTNLSRALLPQAGLAIGLVVILQGDSRISAETVRIVTEVILATVVLNEIIGPPLVRRSLVRAAEAGKDRRRIVEFLQEEHIVAPLVATDKWDAIRKLSAVLIRTHGIKDITAEELVESVEERERTLSTAMGQGVALPHGRVPGGPEIVGVMGICPKGIDFEAPDDADVHFIILIATPEQHGERHQEVLAAVARIMSDPEIRGRLAIARNPAEAFDAIEVDAKVDYNYFLED